VDLCKSSGQAARGLATKPLARTIVWMSIPTHQLAVQLYTLRDFTKTPADIFSTLKKVKEMGYDAVQVSGTGPIKASELAKILGDTGLVCCATHTGFDRLHQKSQEVIDEHRLWGCEYVAIGGHFPDAQNFTVAGWNKFVSDFNQMASLFRGSGVHPGYHNHSHEFAKIDGTTPWKIFTDGLSADAWLEIDTYWVQHGGADPIQHIRAAKGKVPCVHLKDMGIKPDRTHYMMEVGQGNLNWTGILQACQEAGVKWYIVEQDTCYRDPFESLKISRDFLLNT